MSAVVAVLNESLTESLRGFYKLRKALFTLQDIIQAEESYIERLKSSSPTSISDSSDVGSSRNGTALASHATDENSESDDDDDLDFKDAAEAAPELTTPMGYQGHVEYPDMGNLQLEDQREPGSTSEAYARPPSSATTATSPQASSHTSDALDFRAISSEPIDIFIHSGAAMCFGLLQLLLSMIPPAFGKILSIFSFRGDRENGLQLLWEATNFKQNINGAMAGLVLLPFHNAAIALCDIYRREALPRARLQALLREMRSLYPHSVMWILEEARMHGVERDLETAVDILTRNHKPSALKQMEALRIFEVSMSTMFLHRYEECAKSFVKTIDLNNCKYRLRP